MESLFLILKDEDFKIQDIPSVKDLTSFFEKKFFPFAPPREINTDEGVMYINDPKNAITMILGLPRVRNLFIIVEELKKNQKKKKKRPLKKL